MADTLALGASGRKAVQVQLLFRAPKSFLGYDEGNGYKVIDFMHGFPSRPSTKIGPVNQQQRRKSSTKQHLLARGGVVLPATDKSDKQELPTPAFRRNDPQMQLLPGVVQRRVDSDTRDH
jgi:hypothetical protein